MINSKALEKDKLVYVVIFHSTHYTNSGLKKEWEISADLNKRQVDAEQLDVG